MPSQITVRIDAKTVRVGMDRLKSDLPALTQDEMRSAMDAAKFEASGGYSGGASYTVPTVYGQTYQRTGNLGRSVGWVQEGQSYRMSHNAASLETGQEYGSVVLGRGDGTGQGRNFVGRWPNFAATMQKWGAIIVKRMNDAYDKAVKQSGLG